MNRAAAAVRASPVEELWADRHPATDDAFAEFEDSPMTHIGFRCVRRNGPPA